MNTAIQHLKELHLNTMIGEVKLPQDHSLNTMWLNYGIDGINTLIEARIQEDNTITSSVEEISLKQVNQNKLSYETNIGIYYVLGTLSDDLSTLKATIHFEEKESKRKYRTKIDLYDRSQLLDFVKTINEREHIESSIIENDLIRLTDSLENHREAEQEKHNPNISKTQQLLSPAKQKEAIGFLSQPNIFKRIDEQIESSGIVGEEKNRLILFIIASTYKMPSPLHALIQGTSGSGKTHLINAISSLMPTEDMMNMTRVTSKSFYYYQNDDLMDKLVVIQDMDGLDDEAKFAFRELQSAGELSSSIPIKDKYGNIHSSMKVVKANFASLSATTNSEIYYDNMSRSLIVGIDESQEQTQRIIQYQNQITAGLIDEIKANQSKELLQNCIRTLKPYQVVNRYADKLILPVEAKMLRRLNSHFQAFVAQITILHQYQRQTDDRNRLIATKQDLELATEILFDAIIWKVDELDSSLRQVFERMKTYLKSKTGNHQNKFTTREIRQELNLSKSQCHRFINELKELEYIQVVEGSSNKGYTYQISYWDDMDKIRQKVKDDLKQQLNKLK